MNTVLSPDQLTTVSAALDGDATLPKASLPRRLALRAGVWLILRGTRTATPCHDERLALLHQAQRHALAEVIAAEQAATYHRHLTRIL